VVNAICAVTGKRLRKMPVDAASLEQAACQTCERVGCCDDAEPDACACAKLQLGEKNGDFHAGAIPS
jgi:hypothetical protein